MELLLLNLVLVAACLTITSAVECYRSDKSNFCSCSIKSTKTGNNITINLDHIGLNYPAQVDGDGNKYTFQYTPCNPVVCPNTEGASAVCQHVQGTQDYWVSLGRFSNFKWDVSQDDPANLTFKITYNGGSDDRKSIVDFQTVTTTATTFGYSKENGNTYRLTVKGSGIVPYTPSPSSGGSSSGGSIVGPIGLVIMILAIGGLITYCVVGGIYMYKVKGARGSEVVPNAGFWKELPILIKDGFFFTISPCYKRSDYQRL